MKALSVSSLPPISARLSRRLGWLALVGLMVASGCDDGSDAAEDDWIEDDDPIVQRLALQTVKAAANKFAYIKFPKSAGYHYTRCIDSVSGNPNLYGHFAHTPTTSDYQFRSVNGSSSSDCISFDATSNVEPYYYVGVYGSNVASEATYRISSYKNNSTPTHLYKQLSWPVASCKTLTKPTDAGGNFVTAPNLTSYGAFGAPWGNFVYDPFYTDKCNSKSCKNFLHTGTDIACTKGTTVRAACTGPVKAASSAGEEWGHYVVQECTGLNNKKYSVAYMHITDWGFESGDPLSEGAIVGKIADLNVPGESDHLHLAICDGSYSTCASTTCTQQPAKTSRPQGGALPDECFPGLLLNAHIGTNPSLYK